MIVVIADIEDTALQQAAEQLGATGVRTDVRDPASVQALADATVDRYGAVHVVVNNAGVGPMAPIAALELSDWQWLLEVNLWGVIHGVHTFLPLLKQNPDGGHIVNTASIGGLVTGPGMGAYNVSKFGIVALTEVLTTELSAEGSAVGASVLLPGHGAHQHRQQHAEPAGRRVRRCAGRQPAGGRTGPRHGVAGARRRRPDPHRVDSAGGPCTWSPIARAGPWCRVGTRRSLTPFRRPPLGLDRAPVRRAR